MIFTVLGNFSINSTGGVPNKQKQCAYLQGAYDRIEKTEGTSTPILQNF